MEDNKQKRNTGAVANSFTGLPLKALIGAPLKAASDANAMMSRSQTQFILSTCFAEVEQGQLVPVMIDFTLARNTVDKQGNPGAPVNMKFSIPLLSLIPISSLAVEKLKISFEMDVKSSVHYSSSESGEERKKSTDSDAPAPIAFKGHRFNTEMHGTLANKSDRKQQGHAKYDIELEAGTLPLPVGITSILDIFTKNIAPIPVKGEAAGSDSSSADKK